MADRLTTEQQNRNAKNRGNWQRAEPHRQQVTDLLIRVNKQPTDRLAVLGAGNLNDIDLKSLVSAYAGIELFDLDEAAILQGLEFQGSHAEIISHTAGDLTGVWEPLNALSKTSAEESIQRLINRARQPSPPVSDRFEVVASACLLSQLIDTAFLQIGTNSQPAIEVALALRDGHLKLMADLLEPGGRGVLVTDFVSSVTAPALPSLHPVALPGELEKMIQAGNFFTGLNPFAIAQRLAKLSPPLGLSSGSIECLNPWLWDFGPRVYAVTAITFQKDA